MQFKRYFSIPKISKIKSWITQQAIVVELKYQYIERKYINMKIRIDYIRVEKVKFISNNSGFSSS